MIEFTKEESNLIENDLFKKILSKEIISNCAIEQILVSLRKKICFISAENKLNQSLISFLECLSCQCFLTEYVYDESEEELNIINILIDRCKKDRNLSYLPIIACYKHLISFLKEIPHIKEYSSDKEESKHFIKIHIDEPLEELNISKSIKSVGSIKNIISKKVKSQYEINPYPRWESTYVDENVFPIENMLHYFICDECKNVKKFERPKILIAGCGTGKHIIDYRSYDVNSITAIDLSRKSLSFAKRKSIEYGMHNVNFLEMDILNLNLLNEKFDIIECTGVLHHMESPNAGLKKLTECLSSNGYLKLALYSKIARDIIVQAREAIKRCNFSSSVDGIRKFRKEVISGSLTNLQKITTTIDFYSTSTCRDLCFHIHENRFTIKDIVSLLESNNLKFCGFDLPDKVKKEYRLFFPSDVNLTNLNNWEIFEENNPDTFLCMYQFWVKFNN